ncbi:hypothetical protein A5651_21705 [Mycobacterium sp. 1274761.0]|nr:hypothetical protein A5651_21705 [Mycobacterium sp. 1274761.0]
MSAPLSMLSLFGSLDLAVSQAIESGDAVTATIIEQYLPGAIENRGWSEQLYDLFLPGQQRSTDVGFNVNVALRDLVEYDKTHAVSELTIPDLANLVYVIGALKHIPAIADVEANTPVMSEALALAVPPEGLNDEERVSRALTFLNGDLTESFTGWQSWAGFIKKAADDGYVLDLVSKVPQCRTSVVTVNGLTCVVIDADIESDTLTFDNVIAVVDPRNWPKAYPGFFCGMKNYTARTPPDGWYNIVETAGLCKVIGGYKLVQRLRFLKSDLLRGDARLDYDLAENQEGDGCTKKVLVDRGFVNVSCTRSDGETSKPGVRMQTRKVAHVTDISPYAQAFLLCKMGYGWAAVQLFFGPARKPPPGYVGWKEPPWMQQPNTLPQPPTGASGATGKTPTQAGGNAPSTGKPQVATKTAKALADVANYLTSTNLEITKKWLAGQLSFGDLAKYGQEVGGRLASEPWKWLADITTDTSSGGSGGGTP